MHSYLHYRWPYHQSLMPARYRSDVDATYPNCYSEWRNGPYGPRGRGLARVLLLALVALAVLLSSVVVGVVTWVWYEGIVTATLSSIPGATAGLVGTPLFILLVG